MGVQLNPAQTKLRDKEKGKSPALKKMGRRREVVIKKIDTRGTSPLSHVLDMIS